MRWRRLAGFLRVLSAAPEPLPTMAYPEEPGRRRIDPEEYGRRLAQHGADPCGGFALYTCRDNHLREGRRTFSDSGPPVSVEWDTGSGKRCSNPAFYVEQ